MTSRLLCSSALSPSFHHCSSDTAASVVIKDHLVNHQWAFAQSISLAQSTWLSWLSTPWFHIQNHPIIPLPYFCQLYHFPKPFRKETLNSGLAQLPSLPSATLVLTFIANIRNSRKLPFWKSFIRIWWSGGTVVWLQPEPRKDRDCGLRTQSSESPLSSFFSGFLMICTDTPKVLNTPTPT